VLATAAETLTFRLPNTLQAGALAADRFIPGSGSLAAILRYAF
jgi:hypothetical protein